jgi:hypothetical protein
MWRWIVRFFVGHDHHWKIIKEVEQPLTTAGKGVRYYLQCDVCGMTRVKNPWCG